MTWGRSGGDENERFDIYLYIKYLGVRGIVTDKHGTGIQNVTVTVIGRKSHAARTKTTILASSPPGKLHIKGQ